MGNCANKPTPVNRQCKQPVRKSIAPTEPRGQKRVQAVPVPVGKTPTNSEDEKNKYEVTRDNGSVSDETQPELVSTVSSVKEFEDAGCTLKRREIMEQIADEELNANVLSSESEEDNETVNSPKKYKRKRLMRTPQSRQDRAVATRQQRPSQQHRKPVILL